MAEQFIKNIEFSKALSLKDLVDYAEGRVSSKSLVDRPDLSLSIFAFDKGEGLSTHSAPGDAMVVILDGLGSFVIGDNPAVFLREGETLVMPADIPHAVDAAERFKMLLILVKPGKNQ
jgi:quercetin dioxygenase-like cupin family protein